MFHQEEKESAQGLTNLDEQYLLLRRMVIQRLLARVSIEVPVSLIDFEVKRNESLSASYAACKSVYRRSIKLRVKRWFASILRRFR